MTLAEQFVEQLKNIKYDEELYDRLIDIESFEKSKAVSVKVISTSRWTETVETVIQFTDDSFAAYAEKRGLTEIQEDIDPEIKAYLVEPYQKLVTKYRKV